MSIHIDKKPWFDYIDDDLAESLSLAVHLADLSSQWSRRYHDYSFIVFPAAKAYEGFLKKLFFDMGFITEMEYLGKHFRIGKALNPHLDDRYKDDGWVYDKLLKYCHGKELPEKLWKTWKEARNLVFHWFPDQKKVLTHNEAVEKLLMVIDAIDEVYTECKVDLKNAKEKN